MREKVEFNGVFIDSELAEMLVKIIHHAAGEVAINLGSKGSSIQEIEKAVKDTSTALYNALADLYTP